MSKDKKNCPTDFLNISVLIVFKMCRENAASYGSQVFPVVTRPRLNDWSLTLNQSYERSQ